VKKYKKILVVQLGRLGDVILMTPLLRELKKQFPEAKLHFLSGKHNKAVAEKIPYLDKVHVYEKGLTGSISIVRELKKENFDLWIDPKDHRSSESRYFAKLVASEDRIGYNDPDKKTEVFNIPASPQEDHQDSHVIDRNLAVLELIGCKPPFDQSVELSTNPETDEHFHEFIMELGISGFYLINISASKASRYWDLGKWLEFVENYKEHDFIISADPKDHNLVRQILDERPNCYFYQTKSIVDVYSLVKMASMVISPDTSLIHIAAAFDVPVIGLYANLGRNLKKFHPRSTLQRLLVNEESDTFIRDISVSDLSAAFEELLIEIDAK
jgi:ADP-heptose:LPS heptosyltransferase